MRNFIVVILLMVPSFCFAQDEGGFIAALRKKNIPQISSTAPTNGQVLTWDSTLGKAKWAAGGGGGSSFDPAAATAVTFASGEGDIGSAPGESLNLFSGTPTNTNGGDLSIVAASGVGTNKNGGSIVADIGNKTGSGTPGAFRIRDASGSSLFTISYDGTITGPTDVHTHLKSSLGTSLYLETSHETAADEASGDVNIRSGATDDGDTGYIILQVPTPGGSDRSANNIQFYLGAATGSGTPSSFQIYDGSASLLLEVNQDGTLYGPTGKAFEIQTASSQSLHFTSSNQMLFNDAGHYIRMGIGWMNLPSDGGIYWCSETTASTPEAMFFRSGTREYRLASDINADDTDRPIKFSIKSCDGPNLNCGIDLYSNGGTGTISQNYGGAFGGSSTLNLAAGGNTVTVDVTGLTTAIGRIVVGTSGPRIVAGDDSPESAVTAPVGSIYLRKNGGSNTTFYVKESGSGNTGWVAK